MKKISLGLLALSLLVAACGQSTYSYTNTNVGDDGAQFGTASAAIVGADGLDVVLARAKIKDMSGNIVRDEYVDLTYSAERYFELGHLPRQHLRLQVTVYTASGEVCVGVWVDLDLATNAFVDVTVNVTCAGSYVPETNPDGSVRVHVNVGREANVSYPVVTSFDVKPQSVMVGHSSELVCFTSSAPDTYSWSTTGNGTFSTTTSSVTVFTCHTAGLNYFSCAITKDGLSGLPGMSGTNFVHCTDATTMPTEDGMCEDGIDNDGDGTVDCADSDCASCHACIPEICNNGIDDDGDGDTDCADAECSTHSSCQPSVTEICNDGIDNDGNGDIDCNDSACSADPFCQNNNVSCLPQSPVRMRIKNVQTGNFDVYRGGSYHDGTTAFNDIVYSVSPFNVASYTYHNAPTNTQIVISASAGMVFSDYCSTGQYFGIMDHTQVTGLTGPWWQISVTEKATWCAANVECQNGQNTTTWTSAIATSYGDCLCEI